MTMKGLLLHEYNKCPGWEDTPKWKPSPGQLLIKVDAAALNPSDRLQMQAKYFPKTMHEPMGFEGTGIVLEANGEDLQGWVGARVSFVTNHGSWAEFTLAVPDKVFRIDPDVPRNCAASGIVNPLTVIGMLEVYREHQGVGLIHTAAASALGRMLNKACQKYHIPLLNIVRKQEQADLLLAEGAQFVLVTTENWLDRFQELVREHKFNVFFDALGGGGVSEAITENLQCPPGRRCWAFIYGMLEDKPFTLKKAISLCSGVFVSGFLVFMWWETVDAEKKQKIRADYSRALREELSTTEYRVLPMSQIADALELSVKEPLKGKITLVPDSAL